MKIETGTYKNGHGCLVEIIPSELDQFKWKSVEKGIDGSERVSRFYSSDGICFFWSFAHERFFKTCYPKDDLVEIVSTPTTKVVERARPSKLATHMATAEIIAQRSHDADTQVGAVLVKVDTETVIAQCYNGFVRGAPDGELPNTRPDKYEYMCHAEQNLITHCARQGISMENTYVVCTYTPCKTCMRMLWNAGVKKIIAKSRYKDFEDILKMKDLKVVEVGETPEGYIELRYEEV